MTEWIGPKDALARGALGSVRVLELGEGIASAFAARLLADHGASVIRAAEDRPTEGPHGVAPGLSAYLDWNKYSVHLDPGSPRLTGLLAAADVLFVGDDRASVERWGLDLDGLRVTHPGLTVVTVTPFGIEDPRSVWPWSELTVQAASGLMAISGTSDREPLMRGLRQSRYEAGLNAAYTALASLFAARQSGVGALVDLSIVETVSSELILNQAMYSFLGGVQGRRAPTSDTLSTGDPFPTTAGYASVQINAMIPPSRIGEVFEEPRLGDPKFATADARRANSAELDAILADLGRRYSAKEFFETGAREGLLTGFVQTAEQLLSCSHLDARGVWESIGTGIAGPESNVRFPARLGTMSRTPAELVRGVAAPGTHDDRLVPVEPRLTSGSAPVVEGPLSGLRVLDLSSVFAVPYIGALLADLGADVIKIEPPTRLDQARGISFGPWFDNRPGDESWNRSGTFQEVNRGKRSIVLDLKTDDGREVFRKLVATADILLDNFTPRVLRGWDLTYDTLQALNPRLIHLSNTGYGSSGPWSPFKAQGTTLEATMGISSVCGYSPDTPMKIGRSYPDFLACWAGLTMIMVALNDRLTTGLGQWIDLGMYQLGPIVIPEAILAAQSGGRPPEPSGNREFGAAYSTVVPGPECREWIAVSAAGPEEWGSLRAVVGGLPAKPPVSAAELERVDGRLAGWVSERGGEAAVHSLREEGVAAARVADARDLARDPHFAARAFYEKVDFGGDVGTRRLVGRPYRWVGQHQVGIERRAPLWSEDTVAVLRMAGYDEPAIARLFETGVTSSSPVGITSAEPVDIDAQLATGVYDFIDALYRE